MEIKDKIKVKTRWQQASVYFYALPIGMEFIRNGKKHLKTSYDTVVDADGKKLIFNAWFDCIIPKRFLDKLKIKKGIIK